MDSLHTSAVVNLSNRQNSHQIELAVRFILFAILIIWAGSLMNMAKQFPSLFQLEVYRFVIIQWIISATLVFVLFIFLKIKTIKILDENKNGISLSLFFFSIYVLLVSIFNQPVFDVDDIFFDSDGLLWRLRLTTENVQDYYFRSVHPFVLIIIRPLVFFISLFLKGNMLYATFILTALAGAVCVFLVWYFVKHFINNKLYCLLIASLFGVSTAQLVFSSLIETYIFLATVALLFIIFLIKDKSFFVLIITGLLAFGITISNFIQTVISCFLIKKDFKQLIKYGFLVLILTIPMTLLNNIIYPKSQPYFWDFTSYEAESNNSFSPTIQRANFLNRVMLFHSIVAPQPLILEEEIPFLKVWMFRAVEEEPIQIAQYNSLLGIGLSYMWLGLITLGGFLFLKSFRKQDNRFSLTFMFILLFNFFLHLQYGKDVFLYSVNWTYALILFLALAWKELENKLWFNIILFMFVSLLMINNSQLIFTMLSTSALHIK